MSGRIKLLFAFLSLSAGAAVWYVVNFPLSGADGNALSANALAHVSAQECTDTDRDGLCDSEETYWGTNYDNPDTDGDSFLDGEEVLSGHDPAKAGPDDYLNDRGNLTEKTGRLLLGAMITGDMSPTSKNYSDSIDRLVELIFKQYDANTATEIDSISVGDSAALANYSLAMTRLLRQMLPEIKDNQLAILETIRNIPVSELPKMNKEKPEAYAAFLKATDNEIAAFNARVNTIKSLRVPPALVPFHKSFLQYLRGMQQQYRLARGITKDPVQGLISIQVLYVLANETSAELADSFTHQISTAFQ